MYSKKNTPDDKMTSHRQLRLTKIVGATTDVWVMADVIWALSGSLQKGLSSSEYAEKHFFLTFGVQTST